MARTNKPSVLRYTSPYAKRRRPNGLPKYTYGLEGKLEGLIGEPIALAQKVVRPKFETETSAPEGSSTRYTYHIQKTYSYYKDDRIPTSMFPWNTNANDTIFQMSYPTVNRSYTFRVDLWEDSEGKFRSFSFALQVS